MEKQLKWNGKQVNYITEGTGRPVVLLHGFLENAHIWDDFIAFLESGFRIIAIDLPGFGKTGVFGDQHTMSFMADSVKAVLDAEKVVDTVMVGHSMGGYVSLAFARKYPGFLRGLVLFHSHAAADSEEVRKNRSRTIEVVRQNHKDFISQFIPLLFAEENVSRFASVIQKLREESLQTPATGVMASLAGMRDRADHLELLRKASFPVFFVVGKQDSRISLEKIAPQLLLPVQSEALILDGVGHMGFVEAPAKIFPVLRDFMQRC